MCSYVSGFFCNRRDVEAALVREGALPDEGLALVRLEVRELVHELRDVGELLQLRGGDAVVAALQLEDRDDRDEVRVAAALAEAVDGALHLHAAGLDARDGVGDRELAVVVAVDAERGRVAPCAASTPAPTCAGRLPPRVSHRQTTVAPPSAAARDAAERVVGVRGEPVEEVLGVEDHLVGVGLRR
jgi:hypothetical protein